MTLNDAQEAGWLQSMEEKGNDDDGHSVDSDEFRDGPAEDMEWDFHGLQDGDHRGVKTLQVIRELCTRYNVNEPDTIIAALSVIEEGISCNTRAIVST